MRILLIADIHGNWPALQAIREPYDCCLFAGDLVDYGPQPGPCLEWVRRHVRYSVRGNHDHALAQRAVTNGRNGLKYLTAVTRHLTQQLLSAEQVRYLASRPVSQMVTLGGARFLVVHGTPRDPLDEYAPADPELWSRRLRGVDADFVVVGHTHLPYVLTVQGCTVINPGSVGQPRDGDPRACYAIWEDGKVELKRVSYALDELVRQIQLSPLPEQAKRMSIEVFRTGTGNVAELTHAAPPGL
jgi:putative phosphoesterase